MTRFYDDGYDEFSSFFFKFSLLINKNKQKQTKQTEKPKKNQIE